MQPNQPLKGPDEDLTTLDRVNLGLGVLAILFLVGSLGLSYVPATVSAGKIPESLPGNLRTIGLVLMVLYGVTLAYLKRDDIGLAMGTRQAKGGGVIALQILAVIGILAALNYFGTRHHNRIDLTENKQYSLSEQSKKIAAGLKDPVSVTLFTKTGDAASDNLKNLWREYTYAGDKVKLNVVDVDKDPTLAKLNKITAYGSSMLERGTSRASSHAAAQMATVTICAAVKVIRRSAVCVRFSIMVM